MLARRRPGRTARQPELPEKTAETDRRHDEAHLLRAERRVVGQVQRQQRAEHEYARHRAAQGGHRHEDVAALEHMAERRRRISDATAFVTFGSRITNNMIAPRIRPGTATSAKTQRHDTKPSSCVAMIGDSASRTARSRFAAGRGSARAAADAMRRPSRQNSSGRTNPPRRPSGRESPSARAGRPRPEKPDSSENAMMAGISTCGGRSCRRCRPSAPRRCPTTGRARRCSCRRPARSG